MIVPWLFWQSLLFALCASPRAPMDAPIFCSGLTKLAIDLATYVEQTVWREDVNPASDVSWGFQCR